MVTKRNSSNHAWNNLPSPILCNILHYAQHSSNLMLESNASVISACQLVCKGWSQAAQNALYKQVHLGSNTLRFLNTLINAKELGGFVKILVIEESMLDLGDIFDLLEDIFTHCPNIEELYSFEQAVKNDIWTYVNSVRKVPQHLKTFTTTTSDAANSPLYSPMAIRFEDTLTRLQLCFNTARVNNIEQVYYSLLSKRLGHFAFLQHLRIDHWRVKSWQDFDTLLDRCSATLRELVFIHLYLPNHIFPQTYKICPNTNVKHLKIGASNFPAAAIQYFKGKMAVLENFDLLFVSFPDGCLQDAIAWWAHLMQLCMNLTSYNIKFSRSSYLDIYKLRRCIKFSAITTTQWKNIKSKTVTLLFNVNQDGGNVISLSKSWCKYAIDLGFDKVDYLTFISQWMQMYSPHHIHIQGESMDSQYQMIKGIDATQTQKVSTVAARSLLERTCSKTNLHIFFTALSFIARKHVEVLHFDSLVLCYNYPLANNTLNNLQVSELKFTKSILQHQALECISKMFVKIDKLMLDTCCLLVDDPFQLSVCLPFTEMTALELNINLFVNATSWSPHKKQVYSECCSLENLNLLRAVSDDGHFIVKIETQDKTHVFHKQGAGDAKKSYIKPDYAVGNAFTFAIFIKCKQLSEMRIKGEHGLKWDIKIE
ncbi:uncharacterized protein ATC70_005950 [Mucor velutinosus]|uniref:F-box domain-containing protein n=1 Tax=Mucor velutinosus TaxID=708070 RepID=A0AAN7DBY3_9FUNG|nr:hypothetical protein ATC70_005950 [Mucor velutinosus]